MAAIHIGMVLESAFPPDIRVNKEAHSLIELGYKVYLLCLGSPDLPLREEVDGLYIHRIQWGANSVYRTASKVIDRVFLVNFLWQKEIKSFAEEYQIDVLHVHDLPLANNAFAVRKKIPKLKVVLDLHENWPAALQDWHQDSHWPLSMFHRLIHGYDRWLRYEQQAVQQADAVIAVVDEMRERLVCTHGISPEYITVVPNYESRDFMAKANRIDRTERRGFVLLYVGGIGQHRGLKIVIQGLAKLKHLPDLRLVVVGSGSSTYMKELYALIKRYNLSNQIEFTGQQPFGAVSKYIANADVGLVPHRRTEHTDHTIPHKLFQYMLFALPVLVSNCKPLARYTIDSHCGRVFQHDSATDFAKQVEYLYHLSVPELERMGQNGMEAANGSCHWSRSSDALHSMYQNL